VLAEVWALLSGSAKETYKSQRDLQERLTTEETLRVSSFVSLSGLFFCRESGLFFCKPLSGSLLQRERLTLGSLLLPLLLKKRPLRGLQKKRPLLQRERLTKEETAERLTKEETR